MLSVRSLSVCDVGVQGIRPIYGQWIKMKLGTEVGLGPGYIVLDGDVAPPERGTAPLPTFRPFVYCGLTFAHLSNC